MAKIIEKLQTRDHEEIVYINTNGGKTDGVDATVALKVIGVKSTDDGKTFTEKIAFPFDPANQRVESFIFKKGTLSGYAGSMFIKPPPNGRAILGLWVFPWTTSDLSTYNLIFNPFIRGGQWAGEVFNYIGISPSYSVPSSGAFFSTSCFKTTYNANVNAITGFNANYHWNNFVAPPVGIAIADASDNSTAPSSTKSTNGCTVVVLYGTGGYQYHTAGRNSSTWMYALTLIPIVGITNDNFVGSNYNVPLQNTYLSISAPSNHGVSMSYPGGAGSATKYYYAVPLSTSESNVKLDTFLSFQITMNSGSDSKERNIALYGMYRLSDTSYVSASTYFSNYQIMTATHDTTELENIVRLSQAD